METLDKNTIKQEVNKLLTHLHTVDASSVAQQHPYLLSLTKILENVNEILDKEKPDKNALEKSAFSIWRLVTDSSKLEKSWIGESLLEISNLLERYGKYDHSNDTNFPE